jgi:uncharacterized protein
MNFIENGANVNGRQVLLAHSAGAPMDSPFMAYYADYLGKSGFHVRRFEFPYMQRRRAEGGRRPPDRQPILLDCWREAVHSSGDPAELIIGGKSMGGRMASMIADELGVCGLVCLGYPFYAPGKIDQPRTAHLADLKTPSLFLQGSRDTMGNKETVSSFNLSPSISIHWLEDGDHSFKPRVKSGRTEKENWEEGGNKFCEFVRRIG